jgi:hypothetical protein
LGLIAELQGTRVCIDTAPFIYFIEKHPKCSIKTPDAIQIAVGLFHKATRFLTNDPSLKKVSEIDVLVLDDFLGKS